MCIVPEFTNPTAAPFQEVKLSGSELDEVFDKLAGGLMRLPATELGPLVYQMLRLVKVSQ